MKYWKIIADNLSTSGWTWGCVSVVDSSGRTIFAVDAHRDGQRFIVRADEKLTAFVELGDRTDVKPKVKIRIRVVDGEFGSEVLKVDRH